ncbi:MAG: hypothetical protein A2915_03295 [Candidatus Yanofskybacteria bacterium RIFCSPLOWO2_01_FULL_41_34]|uniref:CDP-Glycerol:Poly(Glycerophosphate) glycerophosphotransferase n=1 Tax=Candidatus Yanofskybacteria bacterium RIFCSPHIGHO2_01_FULL_41_26 TaxID=1802661 RepID=A0A1F8EDS2_9BACT|nr:MAG: hypothetical protein A2649_01190 [Candidatus Yanofskybacteria bacterium RIFCSPHIGHO2_01_FULL_41_26]OGN21057.1 MAG: hypothetical protein A2915_03295 [Candidatus Yanofskybacteria bacterium RIFCSPLOWO2_01_FULL_41_34]
MKTIIISAYNTFISRNLFNTDVLKILKKEEGLNIVIFCPPDKVNFFQQFYGGPRVAFEGLDMDQFIRRPWNKKLYRLSFLLENSQYIKDQRLERYENNKNIAGYLNYKWVGLVSYVLSSILIFHPIYRVFDLFFSERRALKPYFDKFNPDFVFAADSFGEIDIWFMKEARSRKTPLITMVRSWDNTTTKGILRLMPDKIIVNSPTVKNELIEIHDYQADDIFVAGLPQFDVWLSGPTETREHFFARIGADPSKKLILFAPAGAVLSNTDWQLCQILKEALENGSLPENVQFLVRNHPQHPADLSKFAGDPSFIIDNPGHMTKAGDRKNIEFRPQDSEHLRNSIYYSDIVMYVATSLGLDSSVFNKPQIMVSFDGFEKKPYIRSVKRYNREDCLYNLVRCGGTKVVKSKEEWIMAINAYLKNPTLDQSGRDEIVKQHLYKIDGKAGERIANILLSFVKQF